MLYLESTPQVWGITGNLGGGKTLTAVSIMVSALQQDFYVVTNIDLNLDAIKRVTGQDFSDRYMRIDLSEDVDWLGLPCGTPRGRRLDKRVLVVIDEVAEWFDQYSSMSHPRIASFFSWLRHSSKRSQDVFFVVQRLDYLQKSLRILIAKWVIVQDMRAFRLPFFKVPIPFLFPFVQQRVFDTQKNLIFGPAYIRKAYWGQFYDTAQCLVFGAGVAGSYASSGRKVLHPLVLWSAFLLLLEFGLLVCRGWFR